MNVDFFRSIFSALNFRLGDGDISIKKHKSLYFGDENPIVVFHSVIKLVNFMRRLTSINVLRLAYLKYEHCSQQYSVKHVFMLINCYRQKAIS